MTLISSCFHPVERAPAVATATVKAASSAASATHATDSIRIIRDNLLPGDILMKVNEDTKLTHRLIVGAQKLAAPFSSGRKGDPNVTHSALWIKSAPQAIYEPEISESRGGESKITLNTSLRHGEYRVYRPCDKDLGHAAAKTAALWGGNQSIRYNANAAAASPFRSSKFSYQAKADAREYGEDATTANPRWGANGGYCSQYVMTAYQGAAEVSNIPLRGALATNARYITPKQLEHQLRNNPDQFSHVGNVRITKNDVTPYPFGSV